MRASRGKLSASPVKISLTLRTPSGTLRTAEGILALVPVSLTMLPNQLQIPPFSAKLNSYPRNPGLSSTQPSKELGFGQHHIRCLAAGQFENGAYLLILSSYSVVPRRSVHSVVYPPKIKIETTEYTQRHGAKSWINFSFSNER